MAWKACTRWLSTAEKWPSDSHASYRTTYVRPGPLDPQEERRTAEHTCEARAYHEKSRWVFLPTFWPCLVLLPAARTVERRIASTCLCSHQHQYEYVLVCIVRLRVGSLMAFWPLSGMESWDFIVDGVKYEAVVSVCMCIGVMLPSPLCVNSLRY